ncbi:MAG: uL15 family ribosomal protein [Anaeroplasma bactoclasticum]|nr:uL15 family ribosomal protein [Anaeroplasma bactoclasticum]MCM1556685.1 uL15 family ribosomal protein [Anaeroplasma bactoclasticum]
MRPSTLIIIIIWAVVICAIIAALVITRLQKNNKNTKDSYSSEKLEKKPRPVKAVRPVEDVKPTPVDKKVEEVVEPQVEAVEVEEQADDFQEEEEPERIVQVVNGRKVFVQYNYSFKAKLILASPEVQQQYRDIINYVRPYGVKTSVSWKQERIYLGRNTFAMLVFKGKKLCVAYALDPKEYEDTKYHVIDLSEVKRFVKTPTLLKITSERKQKYVLELLNTIFTRNELVFKEMEPEKIDIPKRTKDELIEENLIKVYTSDEVTEGTVVEQANVGDIIRKNVTITEAKQLITDDSAMEYVQVEENSSEKTYNKKEIINIDVLSKNFNSDDLVNLETLKEKKLISAKVDYIKVLARGVLDKPLIIEAQDYSIDAIKMIVLTGGEVRKVK